MTPLQAAAFFGARLDEHKIDYAVSGSVAGLFYGAERSTVDVDMGIASTPEAIFQFADALDQNEFYVSREMIAEAIALQDSFNVLHYESPIKLDLFVLGGGLLDRRLISHRVRFESRYGPIWVSSPVDIAVRKLWWFEKADRTSHRQWDDIVALLRGGHVDLAEFGELARAVGLTETASAAIDAV